MFVGVETGLSLSCNPLTTRRIITGNFAPVALSTVRATGFFFLVMQKFTRLPLTEIEKRHEESEETHAARVNRQRSRKLNKRRPGCPAPNVKVHNRNRHTEPL